MIEKQSAVDYSDTMKDFDVDEAKAYLASLKEQAPRRDTMKEKIRDLAPAIQELVELGYTKKRIYDLLKVKFDLNLTYNSFRTYLAQDKGEEDDGDVGKDGPGGDGRAGGKPSDGPS